LAEPLEIHFKKVIDICINSFTINKGPFSERLDGVKYLFIFITGDKETFYGTLIISYDSNISELDSIAIKQATHAIEILSLSKIKLKDYLFTLKHDFVNDLIVGNVKDEASAIQRGRDLNCDISQVRMIIACQIIPVTSQINNRWIENKATVEEYDFYNYVHNYMNIFSPKSVVFRFNDKILVLLHCEKSHMGARRFASYIGNELIHRIDKLYTYKTSVGCSNYFNGISELPQGCQEALSACHFASTFYDSSAYVMFEDIAICSFLLQKFNEKKVCSYISNLFSPIWGYDATNNTDLFVTFRELMLHDCSTREVANKMFLHRNTVLQRKNKIMEILQCDPFLGFNRLQFQLAFIIYNLFMTDL